MKPDQLHDLIRETLEFLGPPLNGAAAEELLLGTAAQESRCGEYVCQLGGGPALGVWQMEPATHEDIWLNFLAFRPELASKLMLLVFRALPKIQQLRGNVYYACAMARIEYLRSPLSLPTAGDLQGQAEFYKKVYNTVGGAATVAEYLHNAKGIFT